MAKKKSNSTILEQLLTHFKENPKATNTAYHIPAVWELKDTQEGTQEVTFNQYFTEKIESVLEHSTNKVDYNQSLSAINNIKTGIGGDWSYQSKVYNVFPRLTTAYDHDKDGHVGMPKGNITLDGKQLLRETGTFLKLIAILPYIKSLGCNVIHSLPINTIGQDGNRGDLGSPYAIKNQYKIDENLADPTIPFTVEEQFKAFVEAAHRMGIRVVLEFVLRTSSLDGDWVKKHPEWFYWIDKSRIDEYQSPAFPTHELQEIKKIPQGGGFYFAPSLEYRSLFKKSPRPEQIKKVKGKYIAKTEEGELVIPGAFADWPPDDIQPAWTDVTYLRMYNYDYDNSINNYNYIAYNTIRYYDPQLADSQYINRPLWDKLVGVIPYYQQNFGIDGVMLDMGHALPKPLLTEIINEARKINPDFGFWEENFEINPVSRMAGFNATLGFEWRTTGNTEGGIKNVIQKASEKLALPFFGTPENHNTPRAVNRGGVHHSKQMWAINTFLPSCMPLIHSGYELLEDFPINTGLNFTSQELAYYKEHRLGLFYKNAYQWDKQENIIDYIKNINKLREKHENWIATGDERTLIIHYPENIFGKIIAFERFDVFQPWKSILVVANTNYHQSEKFYLKVDGTFNNQYQEYLTEKHYSFTDHWISATMEPGQVMIFELHKLI